jgi:hypothetical protein
MENILMAAIWTVPALDWSDDEDSPGMVKVGTLHWRVQLEDSGYSAGAYGATQDTGGRVYTKVALAAVPASVVVGWVQEALGAEEVTRLEQSLADSITEQQNPTSGTITPN